MYAISIDLLRILDNVLDLNLDVFHMHINDTNRVDNTYGIYVGIVQITLFA